MDPDFGTLIPSSFVSWLLTHFACYNIDINCSNLNSENISYATCWTDQFETINKAKPSCRFHRRYKSFSWVEGFWIMSSFNNKIKVSSSGMLMRMDPLLKLLCKTWLASFSKWQGENYNKEGWTIFGNHHPDKPHNTTRIGFIIFASTHYLNNWTLLSWGESKWPEHWAGIVILSQWMRHCSTCWCNSNGKLLWPPRTLDSITSHKIVKAWNIRLYCYIT